MDDRRFDELVKSLAGRQNRRTVLRGLLGLGGVAIGGSMFSDRAEAARRERPTPKPNRPRRVGSACTPFCSPGMCGVPDGCGGRCGCDGSKVCIEGACALPCVTGGCEFCIKDGRNQGCFMMTRVTCTEDIDCQAQFGAGLCRTADSGQKYCFEPTSPN